MHSENTLSTLTELADKHICVFALVGLAAASYDVHAPVRGWGRELLGNGLVIGDDYWHVAEGRVGSITTVDLTQRNFQSGTLIKVWQFPVEKLRNVTLLAETFQLPVERPRSVTF